MNAEKIKELFDSEKGWTTQFEIDGKKYGGNTPQLVNDSRLLWHIEKADGIKGKTVLELGPLEGAHTLTMLRAGAESVLAIEGSDDCYRRCLIVKNVLKKEMEKATFKLLDFCDAVQGLRKFDIVSAAGVLYHQTNPASLIHDLAKITDTVFVWSHVAGDKTPNGESTFVKGGGYEYSGKFNNYGNARTDLPGYCAGLHDQAVWMYPKEMLRCFDDAGFKNVTVGEQGAHPNGDYILFIAKK